MRDRVYMYSIVSQVDFQWEELSRFITVYSMTRVWQEYSAHPAFCLTNQKYTKLVSYIESLQNLIRMKQTYKCNSCV